MDVFVSHTAGEAPIALEIKHVLESLFPGDVNIFVSSDIHDLTPGEKWLRRIEEILKRSRVVLVICSSSSLTRPWINFETGCAWMQGLPIVPICHSGQLKDELPHPFSELNALELENPRFCILLAGVISQHLGVRMPDVDPSRIQRKFERAKRAIGGSDAQPQIIHSPEERTKLITDDLKVLQGSLSVPE